MIVLINISSRDRNSQGHIVKELNRLGLKGKIIARKCGMEEILLIARKVKASAIYCCNSETLKNLVGDSNPSLEDWRGSVLQTSIPIVIGLPIFNIFARKIGRKLFQIDTNKIRHAIYGKSFKYSFNIAKNIDQLNNARISLSLAACLVIDIETSLDNLITSIAFTEITDDLEIGATWVISFKPKHYSDLLELEKAWEIVRDLCNNESVKVFHNGTFDCFHLLRYNVIVRNYIYDTEYLWHCWYSELPKGLAKIASYLLPDFYYWKHESDLSPLEYNAKDTINTARIMIKLWQKAPKWVWTNYCQLMPSIFPAIRINFEGMLTDLAKLADAKAEAQEELDKSLDYLRRITGLPEFNPSSPQQVHALLYKAMGAKVPPRAKSKSATGENELTKVGRTHPIFHIIGQEVIKYREKRKAITTYYDAYLTEDNRLLYSPKIDGTETLRQSCSASSLRYLPEGKNLVKSNVKNLGTQLQNIPYYHKKALLADPGYELGSIDKSQSEARCTAYLTACEALREALENPPSTAGVSDFYCYTGFKFFGVEFNKKHPLRQAVKKIIHGTNYMMGVDTFIDSIGLENLQEYKKILGFSGSLYNFAAYLLTLYHKLYPEVSASWDTLKTEVARAGKIITPDGWTRIVLGDIAKDHNVWRSIVAHRSQHFSVVGINEALWRAFLELQLPSGGDFRIKGQIHDSITYQARQDKFDYYTERMLDIMDIPQPTDFGVMRIPLDVERGVYWKS